MPSIRKRIGYLPSINAQETISKIANKEKLSHSKVVGILVEEALSAREEFKLQNSNNFIRNNLYGKESDMNKSSFNFNDLDELISDKGITYNIKKYKHSLEENLSEPKEKYNEELFELFKKFLQFQKIIQDK
tara:strand:- start:425 stop:820 length:396 start_codon:yes stop_codon:yes gene_type:complete